MLRFFSGVHIATVLNMGRVQETAGQMTTTITTNAPNIVTTTYSVHISTPTAILIVAAIALVIGLIVFLITRRKDSN